MINGVSKRRQARPGRRRCIMLGLLGLAALGLVTRAIYVQVVYADFYREEAHKRHLRDVAMAEPRGMIVDRHGEPLAVSSPVDSLWLDPKLFREQRPRWSELAQNLALSVADLEDLLARQPDNSRFVWLRRHLEPSRVRRVLALKIPGVHRQREYRRFYPAAEVTSQLLGFTDIDDRGLEGLELAFDNELQGVPGLKRVVRDPSGRVMEELGSVRMPKPGTRLTLSIDQRLQYLAYRALKAAVIEHRAAGGSVVLLDVHSGEVLAMVNQPSANPNNRTRIEPERLRNRAVTDVFEPGSTLKPFTVALALESGRYRPDTPVDTRPGWLRVGRNLVRDVHNYGRIDVARVIVKSSNVGTSKIALDLPRDKLWKLYSWLGFGTPTGIEFIGEQSGVLTHHSGWGDFEYATHAFGYGVSVTPLQLAQAYAVLAADGLRRPASLLRQDNPPQGERVLSVWVARAVRDMLEGVVSREGTARRAAVPGYRVGGKTGTVHKIIDGRYADKRYVSVFAGIAPISRPRLAMVVMVDDPRGKDYYGGLVAAPVFSEVMGGALRLLDVPPDALPEGHLELAEADS